MFIVLWSLSTLFSEHVIIAWQLTNLTRVMKHALANMFGGTALARPFTKETAGLFKRVAEAVPAALFSKVGPAKRVLGL